MCVRADELIIRPDDEGISTRMFSGVPVIQDNFYHVVMTQYIGVRVFSIYRWIVSVVDGRREDG